MCICVHAYACVHMCVHLYMCVCMYKSYECVLMYTDTFACVLASILRPEVILGCCFSGVHLVLRDRVSHFASVASELDWVASELQGP